MKKHVPTEFVCYRGDDVVAIGSVQECAEQLGTTVGVIRTQASPRKVAQADARQDSSALVVMRVPLAELA